MEAILKTHDFYYDLPEELIAQDPLEDRSGSRLLVLDKETGAIEHRIFRQITQYLRPNDCLVINNTKVIPARLIGEKLHDAQTQETNHRNEESDPVTGSKDRVVIAKTERE
jgi:S-adenosylmethionine:tRNA ribosyltransferase-isomerase